MTTETGFTRFCDDYNVRWTDSSSGHQHSRPGWIQIDCPWCGPGKSGFHLGFNFESGACHCWKCGKRPLWDVIVELTGEHPRKVIDSYGILPRRYEVWRRKHAEVEIEVPRRYRPPEGLTDLNTPAIKYLMNRAFDPYKLAKQWGIKSTPKFGNLAWRIFIPIYSPDGLKPVSFTTRAIGESKVKYKSASPDQEAMPLRNTLYGEWLIPSHKHVVVCEGPMDVWRWGQGAVATYGVNLSECQLMRLSRYRCVTLAFDPDEAGRKASMSLAETLSLSGCAVQKIELGDRDLADLTPEEVVDLKTTLDRTA